MGEDNQEHLAQGLERAKKICLRLLAHRPRSEREFALKLARRGFSQRLVELTLEWLRSCGLADDREFARWWVDARKAQGSIGRRGLEWELRAKGLDRELVEEALARGFDEQEEIRIGLEAADRRRERQGTGAAAEGRLLRWMRRRGFRPEVIEEVMRRPKRPDS